jgi:WD40 repeat protein
MKLPIEGYKVVFAYTTILVLLGVFVLQGITSLAQSEIPPHQITVNYTPFDVAWSPDGQFIAVGEIIGTHLYDTNLQELHFFSGDSIASIAWNPEGTAFATAGGFNSNQGQVQIFRWDEELNDFTLFTILTNSHQDTTDVAWSPNGEMLATLSRNTEESSGAIIYTTEIWHTFDWTLYTTLKHQYLEGFAGISWSPDSERIAGVGTQYICNGDFCNDATQGVFIADVSSGERLYFLGDESPNSISWSSNNELAINWPELKVYDLNTGIPTRILGIATGRIKWHPSGVWIASAVADAINIRGKTGEFLFAINSAPNFWNMDWSPDGNQLITISENGVIQIWDVSALNSTTCRDIGCD